MPEKTHKVKLIREHKVTDAIVQLYEYETDYAMEWHKSKSRVFWMLEIYQEYDVEGPPGEEAIVDAENIICMGFDDKELAVRAFHAIKNANYISS